MNAADSQPVPVRSLYANDVTCRLQKSQYIAGFCLKFSGQLSVTFDTSKMAASGPFSRSSSLSTNDKTHLV